MNVQQLQQYMQNINERFAVWKKRIFAMILFVIVVMVFKSFNNQHKEIRFMRDSISNFYKDFDVSMLKNPAEMKELLSKAAEISGPLRDLEEVRKASKDVDKKIEILQNFELDKTGKPDLASKAAGARIAGIGSDTKLFYSCNWIMKLLNCPTKVNGPENTIESAMQVGQCFAFRGGKGSLIIELAGKARVDSVTVEHIPKKMSLTGEVTEAPRIFNVTVSFLGNFQ
jgi:Sad1 / UNC-like C-terminal